jgi:hypothetical protein
LPTPLGPVITVRRPWSVEGGMEHLGLAAE